MPPEEEPRPRDPVLAFLSYTQDQRFDVRRGAKRTHLEPGQPGPQPVEPFALVPSAPFVEEVRAIPKTRHVRLISPLKLQSPGSAALPALITVGSSTLAMTSDPASLSSGAAPG